jgi:hypothetical protein
MRNGNGLREFTQFVLDFRHLSGLGIKGVFAAPIICAIAKLAPPPGMSLVVVTTFLQLCCAMLVFAFTSKAATRTLYRAMKVSAVGFCVMAALTFLLETTFTVPIGNSTRRVVAGYDVRPEVNSILTATFQAKDALKGYNYDPNKVWTDPSVLAVQVALVSAWIATFLLLTVFVGSFLLLRKNGNPDPMGDPKPSA